MASIFIPFIVLTILIYGFYKKVDIYDKFTVGVVEGVKVAFKIFPTMFAMMICINVLIKSNIINDTVIFLKPLLSYFNYPSDLVPLAILRPISSSSSLVILDNILKMHGADSFIGRVASVLQGSTDTTIYILGLYFSSVGIKKTKYALIVGLLADFIAVVISIVVVNLLFN